MKSSMLVFFLFSAMILHGQDSLFYYSDGPLSWDLFMGSLPPGAVPGTSRAGLNIDLKINRNLSGDTLRIALQAEAVMNKNQSYADQQARDNLVLSYHQLMFNITERYATELGYVANRNHRGLDEDGLFRKYVDITSQRLAGFEQDFSSDPGLPVLNRWQQQVSAERADWLKDPLEDMERSLFGLAYGLGAGSGFFRLEPGLELTAPLTVACMLDLSFYRFHLPLRYNIGYQAVRALPDGSLTGDPVPGLFSLQEAGFGITLFETRYLRVTPEICGAIYRIKETGSGTPLFGEIGELSWKANLNIDYRALKVFRLAGKGPAGTHRITDRDIRLTLSAGPFRPISYPAGMFWSAGLLIYRQQWGIR
ncbi:MAG: hypothetical protein ACOYXB_11495 [Bacteroidota bacterium]